MTHFVAWHDVSALIPVRKSTPRQILHASCGHVTSGIDVEEGNGLLVLMGASGSGKTTLLTMLAAHEPCATGTIALDGRPYDKNTGSSIGFVPQMVPPASLTSRRLPRLHH